jgi:hypothetical protein
MKTKELTLKRKRQRKYTIDTRHGCMLRENMIVRCLFVGVSTQRERIRSRAAKHRLDAR